MDWQVPIATAVIAAAIAAPRLDARETGQRLLVAAVDTNGLYPIARFDGSGWVNTWPEPDSAEAFTQHTLANVPIDRVPKTWLAGVVPETWSGWRLTGDHAGALRVARTATIESGCSVPIDLATVGPVPDAVTFATAGERTIDVQVLTLSQPDPGARRAIVDLIAARQTSILDAQKRWQPGERENLEAILAMSTPEIVTFLRSRQPGGVDLVFFSVDRKGKAQKTKPHGVHMEGWLREDSAGYVVVVQSDGGVIDTESVEAGHPLGAVRLGGREFWFLHRVFYEGSDFVTVDVSTSGIRQVARMYGGGC